VASENANQYIVVTVVFGQFGREGEQDSVLDDIAEIAGPDVSLGWKRAQANLGSRIPEVLHVATNGAEAYIGGQLVGAAGRLAKRAWQRRKERGEDPGEVGVIVYGPKGEELTRVVSKPPDGKPVAYNGRMSPLGVRVPKEAEWKRGPRAGADHEAADESD
jgi:hypothetical protein